MSSTLLISFGLLIGGWAFLSVLGNERQRLVQNQERERAKAAADAAAAAAAAAKAPETPVGR
jgi:hypothetical protein